jgi:tetratricopeptide (TPR) repeat protein/CHAT domain-containing protein
MRRLMVLAATTALALALVTQAADKQPAGAEITDKELLAAYEKGEALYRQGRYQEALPLAQKVLERAVSVYSEDHVQTARAQTALALVYRQLGEYAKAEPLFQRGLAIREAKLGKDHTDVAESLNQLAWLYQTTGRYDQAELLYQRILAIREAKLGKEHPDVAQSLNDLALLYRAIGQYDKAESLFQRSLSIREAKLGKDHTAVAQSLNNLALLCQIKGQYDRAESLYQCSLAILEARLGKDHPDVGQCLGSLGMLYRLKGQYTKAELLLQRSLTILETKLGKDHRTVAYVLNGLATLYQEMGQLTKAEPLYQRSLAIGEARLGKDHPDVAYAVNDLGLQYQAMGQYAKAEPLHQRSLEIREAKLGKDHIAVAQSLESLALLYQRMGQYARAEPLYQRSLAIREARQGKDHPDVAQALNNLAVLYELMGQYPKAEALHQRSLEIREAKLGKDHPAVSQSLNNLGRLYQLTGQYPKAEPLSQRSLAIREAKLGKDHPAVAVTLNDLATLYREQGQYAKAEPLYQRSLAIAEASVGKDHPEIVRPLSGLATLYRDQGEYAKAEPLYLRSLHILEVKVGKDHPDVAKTVSDLAWLYAAQGDWPQAARTMDGQRRGTRLFADQVLPLLSELEQLRFLDQQIPRLDAALTLAWSRPGDPYLLDFSATWLLNAKRVAQQALAERVLLERQAADPARQKVVRRLQAVRQERAALALQIAEAGQEANRLRRLEELAKEQSDLEQELRRAGGEMFPTGWVELGPVRGALPADAVLIEIGRFRVARFKALDPEKRQPWGPAHYAAWVIPPRAQGDVQLIDLGEADPIDQAITALRKELRLCQSPEKGTNPILRRGAPDAEKQLRPALAEVSRRVLEPLRKHIDGRRQWLLSPDGALWLVPWAALPLDDKTYVIEKHTVRYLVSGRDLVTPGFQGKVQRDASVIMADPDFDVDPKEATAVTAKLLGKQPPADDGRPVALDNPQGARSGSAVGRVGRLPGTAAEATAIKPKLQTYTGEEPWVYRGKNALEGVFKSFHSPKVVLLSTHGFFLEDQGFKGDDRGDLDGSKRPLLTKDGKLPENPLLRCGLLLAGCNQAAAAKPGQEDGVLTGLEIVGCDLRGTELVVLSACETGLGQVRNGEGVAGLRQAFQLAGAQTVVASLWQVADRDTALLMSDFFDGLAKGKTKAEALREAQLARIKAHRDRDGAAHPFFWAAFTVTGK